MTAPEAKRHRDPIEDRLIPLEPLDLKKVHSIDDLLRAMAKTAFTGRQLGEAVDVLEAMARDKDCFVVMTLAGAMTVAKQGLIVAELIDRGIVNAIVSTGALMAHGLVEATGRAHFRYNPEVSDEELYQQGYNRVYDTLEPEQNLDDVEKVMFEVLEQWDPSEILCSYKLNHAIGEFLASHAKGQRGILKSAYEKGVPVFVPCHDSNWVDVCAFQSCTGRLVNSQFDPFESEHFASTLLRQKKLGIFTIGGECPELSQRFSSSIAAAWHGKNVPLKRYHYGLVVRTGSLLGRMSESPQQRSVSWGSSLRRPGAEVWRVCGRNRRPALDCSGGTGRLVKSGAGVEKEKAGGGSWR
jgi:deoxyhypusine synthase